jgi:hypothetical protein
MMKSKQARLRIERAIKALLPWRERKNERRRSIRATKEQVYRKRQTEMLREGKKMTRAGRAATTAAKYTYSI